MNQIIIVTQVINLLLIVSETVLVFKNMKNKTHYFLFISCIAMLLCSTGYLLMIFSETEESYFTSLILSWGGKVGVVISILFFCIELCKYKLPLIVTIMESGFAAITYGVIISTRRSKLFYKSFYLEKKGILTFFQYEQGPWYALWSVLVITVIITCLVMLFRSLFKEKEVQKRKQYLIIIIAAIMEVVIGFLTKLPIGKYYDFNQLGFSICAILFLYAIFRNNLMDTETMAKDYIIDQLSAGVIAMDTSENVVYYNNRTLQIFPEIETDASRVIELINNSIQTKQPINIEDKIYTFEERKLVHNANDESKLYVVNDSTEYFQYMRELEEKKELADAANKAKSDFLASMSHEIRTPINAVLGMDEMILRESTESAIKEYAKDIQAAGRTLLTIINDILDLNKIESGKMEIVPSEYDVSSMLYDISNMIKIRAKEKSLEFKVSVSPDIPSKLYGDDLRIRQILMNLLTNAVKYTNSGTVCFKVSINQEMQGQQADNIILHFEVEDTGIGIKAEDMEKLFSEFERIELERNRNIEGTGLGMPITTKLLSLMESELEVESEYGKGSIFSFDLKQKVVDKVPVGDFSSNIRGLMSEQNTYTETLILPDTRVLIVDDNEMNRKVFIALLKKTQIEVTQAGSGYEAIELATAQHFDVIFMDHMMPGIDGVEAMKMIKAIKEGPCANTPIVVLTANAVVGLKEKYLEDGFDGFLSKPVVYEKLENVIRKVLYKE